MDEKLLLQAAIERGEKYMLVFIKHQEGADPLWFTSYPPDFDSMWHEKRWWTRKSRGYSLKHVYDLENYDRV